MSSLIMSYSVNSSTTHSCGSSYSLKFRTASFIKHRSLNLLYWRISISVNIFLLFLHSEEKKTFLPYHVKNTILHSKWTLLKSCCFFLISLRSITNLAHDFKSPFLDIEILELFLP